MDDEALPCPRCSAPLEATTVLDVPVDRCPHRHGFLVEQRRMIPLTQSLADAACQSIDPDDPIRAVPNEHDIGKCPDCDGPMTRFGYMETRLVTLDRCSRCSVIWIDNEAVEPMVRLTARTLGRAREQEAELHELERHLSAILWSSGDTSGINPDLLLEQSARLASHKIKPPSKY